ncbi:hypothetical protein NEOLI_001082 [Neolecta irregularis DAH-3]|uniref:Protein RCR2 n=1 Tax=Neolecta irregularis (strain DAH-3) TaxID=1198029 RepID=A0A1U7LGA8_NEOID|nr:hypothetical protein NEOLI_001082 [Neolecta irregularis DAH-3]|eukprot:OLL21690.1 hypothetical protein NEOLI_001082 [Neolecta irregularis DAH-3]
MPALAQIAGATTQHLVVRSYGYYCDSFGRCYYQSRWSSFGRWILLGGAVTLTVLFALCAIRSRRRRLCVQGQPSTQAGGFMGRFGMNKFNQNQQPSQLQYQYNQGPQYAQQQYGQQQPAYQAPAYPPVAKY